MMKGIGPGLTPGGDDFISGMLIALNLCSAITKTDFSVTISKIMNAARGENLFTNSFLECAARGQVSEKFKQFLRSLLSSPEEIQPATNQLLAVGATSGADQATGFFIGMKRFFV